MKFTLVVLFSACTITALAHIVAVLTSAARRWRSTGSTRAVSYVDQMLLPWGEIGIALLVFAATIGAASATGTIVELDVLTAALVAFSTTVAGAAVVHRLAAWPAPRACGPHGSRTGSRRAAGRDRDSLRVRRPGGLPGARSHAFPG